MFDIVGFYQAKSAADAVRAMHEDPTAAIICGGTDLLIKLRARKVTGCKLVSILRLNELREIKLCADGQIRIGAAACFRDISENEIIRAHIPALAEACELVGGPEIRNMASIGGNVCNGAVSADSAAMLKVLDAELVVEGISGERLVSIHDFYIGPGKTVLRHDDVLTAIVIKSESYSGLGARYLKFGKRNAMEIATLGCAVGVKLDSEKLCVAQMRIAFTVAAPTPVRCNVLENKATGMRVDDALIAMIGKEAPRELSPRDSWRASKEFRLHIAAELAMRAAVEAIKRAGGNVNA
ncbi:MAG: xanthine dehydrogenase FAD-binding subunit XdhB [Clostridia bacterium]